ncbi:putative DNA-binding transcriptional regulator YafY [Rhizobium soli]|uniref:Putative DNA-binding transcriptional regulator YafY n=2 Tax=Rhizobium soli TaxID=424798 RepID=A0A7X0JPQ8_9HYPH|nr:putative DNA-binding transcriptional regulator YafY [Rhizobium soli]
MTGRDLAVKLEVSVRTVYRDCNTLQAMGIPIEGEAGVGFVMRKGYDLPPLAFSAGEQEAIIIGLRMLGRTGDPVLLSAAESAISKLITAASISERKTDATRFVSQAGAPTAAVTTTSMIREAISSEKKTQITYTDNTSTSTRRTVWPLSLIYYPDASVLSAWCELRGDFRHFRLDRVTDIQVLSLDFRGDGERLRREWRNREDWPLSHPGAFGS